MLMLNQPRVDALWRQSVPTLLPSERKKFPIISLQSMRANILMLDRADWQRRHLKRLDGAQQVAIRLGIGLDGIKLAFGRVDVPELPEAYDAAGLLDLPDRGRLNDPAVVRRALAPYLLKDKEPRPLWLDPGESWPPPLPPGPEPG
jgi:hypothetical protein